MPSLGTKWTKDTWQRPGQYVFVCGGVTENGDIFLSGEITTQGKSHRMCDLGIMVHGCT